MRLTMRTNLAMRILMYCAVHPEDLVRSGDVARACNASAHHVAQVVNQLATMGFLHTLRGRAGGMKLARKPETVTVGEVFGLFEAGLPLTECFDDAGNTCPLTAGCRLREALVAAQRAFYCALDKVTLQELICDNPALHNAFASPSCLPRRAGGANMALAI
ncbi:RrF2 family transcriptional regulator [Paracoccus xiamenensis]|uniref:RrF2 family transcriptional regulator n=1 Tax=Paracoccus xiamenensis TaxID=2714901 RepID=UPI00140A17CA|nr:Rrf2 family transcriptional regulator [Paracoccus xiamenensis]NHF73731.1 Rrf2 family transcriptional regulator [Paracoccus xiamenensis]